MGYKILVIPVVGLDTEGNIVGCVEGIEVSGICDGRTVGSAVVGIMDGKSEGLEEGLEVSGD